MSSIPQQNEEAPLDTCHPLQYFSNTTARYYLLLTPTIPFEQRINNQFDAAQATTNIMQDFANIKKDLKFESITSNEQKFIRDLVPQLPPVGVTPYADWQRDARAFCEAYASTLQPTESIIIGYWDEFEYFSEKAKNLEIKNAGLVVYTSFADTQVQKLPKPPHRFSITQNNSIHDILYPPFDISMAILLDRDKLGNAHPTFLPLLWNLQKTLRQAAIAILEIGSASSQIHIFDLQQLPSVSYKKTELRLYQMLLHNAPETPLTETIISSIQSGRCFACHTPPQPTACVVPYGFPANPLIYRPQSYHNHLADPKNSQKGIGATWLPGDVLAVAEGRWLWDIAFPYDNSNEKQNEIIAATSAPSQQPVLASTTNVARLEFNHPKDHARMPPFCNPPPVDPNKWDAFLNRL